MPTLLPNCPKYLSKITQRRESPESKKLRLEMAMVEKATEESRKEDEEYKRNIQFSTLDELYIKLKNIHIGNWIVSKSDRYIHFLFLKNDPFPKLQCCIRISENLNIAVFCDDLQIRSLGAFKFTETSVVNNTNEIESILNMADMYLINKNEDIPISSTIETILEMLDNLKMKISEKEYSIEFLKEQIKLLNVSSKTRFRYECETIVFCSLIHSISPHAYKFIRSFGNLILPSISTIKRLCGKLSTDPSTEQNDATILQYISTKLKYLNQTDKTVMLLLDEIHLKPYLDYKGGNILGNAHNSNELAKSA